MQYLGSFCLREHYARLVVYVYRKKTGEIQFLSSKAQWCCSFKTWAEAQLHIPTHADRYIDEANLAS